MGILQLGGDHDRSIQTLNPFIFAQAALALHQIPITSVLSRFHGRGTRPERAATGCSPIAPSSVF